MQSLEATDITLRTTFSQTTSYSLLCCLSTA